MVRRLHRSSRFEGDPLVMWEEELIIEERVTKRELKERKTKNCHEKHRIREKS